MCGALRNGKIYPAPYKQVGSGTEIDLATRTTQQYGTFVNDAHYGASLGDNGFIVLTHWGTFGKTVSTGLAVYNISGTNNFRRGAVFASDGSATKCYTFPSNVSYGQQINKITLTAPLGIAVKVGAPFNNSVNKYMSPVLGIDGKIYVGGHSDTGNILEFDPTNDTYITHWSGLPLLRTGCSSPDGTHIYFTPNSGNKIHKFNISTKAITEIGDVLTDTCINIRLLSDGRIIGIGFNSGNLLTIDTTNDTTTETPLLAEGAYGIAIDGEGNILANSRIGNEAIGIYNLAPPYGVSDVNFPPNHANLATSNYNKFFNVL
jgi:hypothetical protein